MYKNSRISLISCHARLSVCSISNLFNLLSFLLSFMLSLESNCNTFFTHGRLWSFFFCGRKIFELQNHLQKMTITRRPDSDSGTTPPRFLQLNLSLEGFREINDEKLDKRTRKCNSCKDVKISLGPCPHDLDAARSPNLFGCRRDWLRLNTVAAHNIDEPWWDVCGVYAAAVENSIVYIVCWHCKANN